MREVLSKLGVRYDLTAGAIDVLRHVPSERRIESLLLSSLDNTPEFQVSGRDLRVREGKSPGDVGPVSVQRPAHVESDEIVNAQDLVGCASVRGRGVC